MASLTWQTSWTWLGVPDHVCTTCGAVCLGPSCALLSLSHNTTLSCNVIAWLCDWESGSRSRLSCARSSMKFLIKGIAWFIGPQTSLGTGFRDGVQGWRSGESTRLTPMWPGIDSGVICGLSLLILFSAPKGFLRVLQFPLSSKTTIWLDLC